MTVWVTEVGDYGENGYTVIGVFSDRVKAMDRMPPQSQAPSHVLACEVDSLKEPQIVVSLPR